MLRYLSAVSTKRVKSTPRGDPSQRLRLYVISNRNVNTGRRRNFTALRESRARRKRGEERQFEAKLAHTPEQIGSYAWAGEVQVNQPNNSFTIGSPCRFLCSRTRIIKTPPHILETNLASSEGHSHLAGDKRCSTGWALCRPDCFQVVISKAADRKRCLSPTTRKWFGMEPEY